MARASPTDAAMARIEIGMRLRLARQKAGWGSIREAAEAAGLGRVFLTQLEGGRSAPSAETIQKLVRLAGYDPRVIFPRRVVETAEQPIT